MFRSTKEVKFYDHCFFAYSRKYGSSANGSTSYLSMWDSSEPDPTSNKIEAAFKTINMK